jgi:hypothetical protein
MLRDQFGGVLVCGCLQFFVPAGEPGFLADRALSFLAGAR